MTNKSGVVNNVIKVRKTDFEVFDALKTDSEKCADISGMCKLFFHYQRTKFKVL